MDKTYIDSIQGLQELLSTPDQGRGVRNLHLWLGKEKGLGALPNELGALVDLEHLEISNCQVDVLPRLNTLTNLKFLKLCLVPKLTEFPGWIAELTQLETLRLDRCTMKLVNSIPDDLSRLAKLESLYIRAEEFAKGKPSPLPAVIGRLPALRELDLFCSYFINDISPAANLPHLQSLRMHTLLEMKDFSALSQMTNLQELDLSFTGVKSLSFAASLTNLESLELKQCSGVKDLKDLVSLPVLKYLGISSTGVRDLSPLASIPTLASLDIHCAHCDDHGKAKSIEALLPLVDHPNLKELGSFEVSEEEWAARTSDESIFNIQLEKPADVIGLIRQRRDAIAKEIKAKELQACLKQIQKTASKTTIQGFAGALKESFRMFEVDADEPLERVVFRWFEGSDDYEAMGTGFNSDGEEIFEEVGGFSIKPIMKIVQQCDADQKSRAKLEEFARFTLYEILHNAMAIAVKDAAFLDLPREAQVDVFLEPHDDDPVLVYRHTSGE